MADEDRRRSPRVPAELRVEFKHLGRPKDSYAELTKNLSAGGVFVGTTVALEVGTEVALEIAPGPGAKPIRLRAEVVRVEEEHVSTGSRVTARARGMGLSFKGSDPTEVRRLIDLSERMKADNASGSNKRR